MNFYFSTSLVRFFWLGPKQWKRNTLSRSVEWERILNQYEASWDDFGQKKVKISLSLLASPNSPKISFFVMHLARIEFNLRSQDCLRSANEVFWEIFLYLLSPLDLLTSTSIIGIIYLEHNQAWVKGLASLFANK